MDVGFTGTQKGMTVEQKEKMYAILLSIVSENGQLRFHHGDCIGSDAEACQLAYDIDYYVVGHPSDIDDKRAFMECDESREPKPYRERNLDIVRESDLIIATPKELKEITRSGTWMTIRLASKKPLIIVWPDGIVEHRRGSTKFLV